MAGGRKSRAAALGLLGVFWAGSAFAQDTGCFSFGYGIDDLEAGGFILGRVNALSPRVNFVKRDVLQKGCPASNAACRDKAYLVPGDEVVIIGGQDEFVCAVYADRKGHVTDGWLPRAALTVVQEKPSFPPEEWLGTWRSGPEQEIRIARGSKTSMKIKGDATWGASDPGRVARGAVNIGEIEGEASPEGNTLSFGIGEDGTLAFHEADDADCKVQMKRLGAYLLVKDNNMCGGANVTFTGVYRRQ